MDDGEGKPNISISECVRQSISDIERAFGKTVNELAHLSYLDFSLSLSPGVESVQPDKKSVFYRVTPEAAFQINVAAQGNREAFEMLREICESNAICGEPVPVAMRPICSQIISGKFKPPSARGPKPRADFGLFFISYYFAEFLSDAYGIPKTRGDGMDETSVADVISEALAEKGLDAKYSKIRDFLTHKKHKLTRQKCNWLIEMMHEPYLKEIGLISRQRWFGISPFGLFLPMGRMT